MLLSYFAQSDYENNLLSLNHHAYRTGHSTATAVIQMVDTWTQAIDSGQLSGVCMIDLSAAFDMVQHDLLLEKMACYGFSKDILKGARELSQQ